MNKSTQVAYILRVSGNEQIAMLKNAFGNNASPALRVYWLAINAIFSLMGISGMGLLQTLTVREVEHEDVETIVYSMETSTGTLVASSGLISHNCFPKDVRALAHMADEPAAPTIASCCDGYQS